MGTLDGEIRTAERKVAAILTKLEDLRLQKMNLEKSLESSRWELEYLRDQKFRAEAQQACDHEWGCDGAHSEPAYCKKCFVSREGAASGAS